MASISIGWWSVINEIGDVDPIAERMREICGPSSAAFPFVVSPVRNEKNETVISYAVLRGHVPVHIDRRNANERTTAMFMFVLEAENRPVLLAAPANQENSQVVLMPEEIRAPRMGFGAIELWAGKALHFDIAKHWHGITGFPTGDVAPGLPECVMVQVPWERADDIGGALLAMKRTIRADERFTDLLRPRQEGLNGGERLAE